MSQITERTLADADHAVVTVTDGGNRYRREPCPDCPWRIDSVGVFPAEAFRLAANAGLESLETSIHDLSAGTRNFGCHSSGPGKTATCAGYILKGQGSIGWRLALATGKFDPAKVRSEVPLFCSYFDMAVANGVPADDPALDGCRPWRTTT